MTYLSSAGDDVSPFPSPANLARIRLAEAEQLRMHLLDRLCDGATSSQISNGSALARLEQVTADVQRLRAEVDQLICDQAAGERVRLIITPARIVEFMARRMKNNDSIRQVEARASRSLPAVVSVGSL